MTEDEMIADDMAKYMYDPLGFVMYSYPWDSDPAIQMVKLVEPWKSRYNQEYGPDEWACQFLDDLGAEVTKNGFNGNDPVPPVRMAVTSGHGVGKSAMTGWLTNWIMSTRPYAQGTVTANTSAQLETKTWAQIAKWTRLSITGHWFKISTGRGSMKMSHLEHPESWFCSAQTCREENSESFAGQHAANSTSFYINDEASAIPDKIYEVQDGGLTDGEPMQFCFGNPTKNTGRFREFWRRLKHRWKTYRIDSRDVQITNKKTLAELIDDYGEDSDIVKIRVKGLFPSASVKQFISESLVDAAFGKHLRKDQYQFAPVIIAVDPAWTGDDEFVIAMRQGLYFKILKVVQKNDDDVLMANIIAGFEDEYQADCVNVDLGYGTGIVSVGQSMGRQWNLIPFGGASTNPGCKNKRADMYNDAKSWLKIGASIPEDDLLRYELTSIETHPRTDGIIQLAPKESPSPGRADALALTFATKVYGKIRTQSQQRAVVVSDYDPYA
jgi:hypothetical protein